MNQDTSESWAMCEDCGEQRRFVPARAGSSRVEEGAANPGVSPALQGAPGSACSSCGHFRLDPVQQEGDLVAPTAGGAAPARADRRDDRARGAPVNLTLPAASDVEAEEPRPSQGPREAGRQPF